MSIILRRTFYAGLSILLLMSTTTGVNNINVNASHYKGRNARIVKNYGYHKISHRSHKRNHKKHVKHFRRKIHSKKIHKYYYKKVQGHRYKKSHKKHIKKPLSEAQKYQKYNKQLKFKLLDKSIGFDDGWHDALDGDADNTGPLLMTPSHINKKNYKQGWIVGAHQFMKEQSNVNAYKGKSFKDVINDYNKGIFYIKNYKPSQKAQLDNDGQWSTNGNTVNPNSQNVSNNMASNYTNTMNTNGDIFNTSNN